MRMVRVLDSAVLSLRAPCCTKQDNRISRLLPASRDSGCALGGEPWRPDESLTQLCPLPEGASSIAKAHRPKRTWNDRIREEDGLARPKRLLTRLPCCTRSFDGTIIAAYVILGTSSMAALSAAGNGPSSPLRIVSHPPAPDASPYLSLIVPAYNEEKRLPATLERIATYLGGRDFSYEMIIVDDGSRDNTNHVVREFGASHPWSRLLQYVDDHGTAINRGKGFAVRAGILASKGRDVLFSDADLSTPIEELEKLLPPLSRGDCDIAIASRSLPDSNLAVHQPWHREAMGRTFNFFVRRAIHTDVSDTQCGFKAMRGDVARRLFALARVDGFGFDTELIFLAAKKGLRVREIPVTWRHVEESRVNPIAAPLQMMRELLEVRLNDLRGLYEESPASQSEK